MRAYRTGLWRGLCVAALTIMWAGSAGAVGGLVSPDGNGTISATRAMIVKSAGEIVLNVQMRYVGTPASAVWLVPLPNFTEPGDDGVRSGVIAQEALDELARATWPILSGECEGMPAGGMQQVSQIEQYGPANQMALPTRFFTVNDITMGSLDNYLDGFGITLDAAMAEAVNRVIDENFMLAAVRIDTAELGVNRIDPIVSIRYPAEAGDQIKLGLRLLAPSVGMGPADMVLWLFDQTRLRANFATDELDYSMIRFIAPGETDYVPQFDMQVGANQSQRFIVENARALGGDAFADPELVAAADATGFLTRLRARIIPAALRNNVAFVSFRDVGSAEVAREHAVQSLGCGMQMPDMGPTPDMGGEGAGGAGGGGGEDMGPAAMDMGGLGVDLGDDDDDDGGGDASGCLAAPGLTPSGWPILLLLPLFLCLPGVRRRG